MSGTKVEIRTADGVAPAELFKPQGQPPQGQGRWPGVILYMDVIGIRPALSQMAERFAREGYLVLLPDLFYRAGPYAPLVPSQMFQDAGLRDKMFANLRELTMTRVREDTGAYLDFLAAQPECSGKVGAVGYCMGGPCALTAAGGFPDRVAAAASFHGGRLATDASDSPHLLAPQMKARIYVGVAGVDEHFTGAEEGRLATALRDAGVDHAIETYAGARHGFAVDDVPAYDEAAAERHWARSLALFAETLR